MAAVKKRFFYLLSEYTTTIPTNDDVTIPIINSEVNTNNNNTRTATPPPPTTTTLPLDHNSSTTPTTDLNQNTIDDPSDENDILSKLTSPSERIRRRHLYTILSNQNDLKYERLVCMCVLCAFVCYYGNMIIFLLLLFRLTNPFTFFQTVQCTNTSPKYRLFILCGCIKLHSTISHETW